MKNKKYSKVYLNNLKLITNTCQLFYNIWNIYKNNKKNNYTQKIYKIIIFLFRNNMLDKQN